MLECHRSAPGTSACCPGPLTTSTDTRRPARGLFRDLLETSSAQAVSVLLNAASLAVISRRFGEFDLGLYTLERRSMAFLQPLILLGLSVATPRFIARSLGRGARDDATYAWVGSAMVAAFAAGLSLLLFLLPGPTAAVVFGDSGEVELARALAGFAFVTALFQIVYSVFRGYLRMTRANVLELLVVGALPFSLALVGPTDLVEFMWALNGGILVVTLASLPLGKRLLGAVTAVTSRAFRDRARQLLRFGLSRTPGDIAIVALFSIPPVAVVHFATAAEAGYTSVVISALNLVSVLAVPLGVLLLPRVAIAAGSARGIPREKYVLLAQATLDLSLAFAALLVLASPVLLRLLLPNVQPSVVTALQVGAVGLPGYVFYLVFRSYLDAVDTRPLSSYATLSGVACLVAALAIALGWDLVPSPVAATCALSLSLIVTGGLTMRMVDRRLGSFASIRSLAPAAACCLAIAAAGVALRGAPSIAIVGAGLVAACAVGLLFHLTARPWLLELTERARARWPHGLPALRRPARLEPALAICMAAVIAFGLAFPTLLPLWAQLVLLGLLLLASVLAQGRAFGALTLFALAFVVVLGSRAVILDAGSDGRYFTVTGHSDQTIPRVPITAPIRTGPPYLANYVRNPSAEGASLSGWAAPTSNARPSASRASGFKSAISRVQTDAYRGSAAAEATFTTGSGASFVALDVGTGPGGRAPVKPGGLVSATIAARAMGRLPRRAGFQLHVGYLDARGRYIGDRPLRGAGAVPSVQNPRRRRWYRLYGTSRAPDAARFALLVPLIRGLGDHSRYAAQFDAASLVPGVKSARDFVPYSDPPSQRAVYRDAARRAMAIVVVLLAAVIAGYLLPLGTWLARRVPELTIADPEDRTTSRLLAALTVAGVAGYLLEMRTYGGYGGYLDSLHLLGVAGLGKWYLHAIATLPAGAAVMLLARHVGSGRGRSWTRLELLVVILGPLIAISYWLKATIAIPALAILLFSYFRLKRGAIKLVAFAVAFALATPLIYLVRGSGSLRLGTLLTGEYWSEFFSTLSSRFFHFESLIIAVPYPASEHPWQPFTDFFVTLVPRVFWEGKPLSPSARFTSEHLLPGLHTPTDVGVISLPGELWLVAGGAGIVIGGLVIGALLRATWALITRRRRADGTLLLAATLLSGLVFANDGWGLASIAVTMLIASVGWLVFLRPQRTWAPD